MLAVILFLLNGAVLRRFPVESQFYSALGIKVVLVRMGFLHSRHLPAAFTILQ